MVPRNLFIGFRLGYKYQKHEKDSVFPVFILRRDPGGFSVLTDEGMKIQRKVNKVLRKPPAAMKSLSDEELVTLTGLLGKLESGIPED